MTIKKIAEALCESQFEVCAKLIIPPWIEGADDRPARDGWRQVLTLRRQRDELGAMWPEKKARLDAEFNDAVMKVAGEVHEALYDISG